MFDVSWLFVRIILSSLAEEEEIIHVLIDKIALRLWKTNKVYASSTGNSTFA